MKDNQAWVDRLQSVIPWGSSTCSKAARLMPEEPGVIVRGQGCRVWDAEGREFIDYRNALGPITLGYCFPAVDTAIRAQLDAGIVFGHPHPLEAEVAEALCEVIPCADRARFLKTGGEALAACIRLARYHTGRDHIVQIGYNGWLNSLAGGGLTLPGMSAPDVPPGVPAALSRLHHACDWNDTERLQSLFDRTENSIAAVVVAADYARMAEGKTFLPWLRERVDQHGALLIFDEIVTGFRIALGGIQEHFAVTPDLAVFAKGIANGMPLSVYCGRAAVMDGLLQAPVSSTYGGETLSLAAAKGVLGVYRAQDVVGHLWRMADRLRVGANTRFAKHQIPLRFGGYGPCMAIQAAPEAPEGLLTRFMRCAYRHGVSLYNIAYTNFSHQAADITDTLQRLEKAVMILSRDDARK